MKIKIKSNPDSRGFSIRLPYKIATSRLACSYFAKGSDGSIKAEDLHKFLKVCKKELKQYKGLTILEVQSADGELITITI